MEAEAALVDGPQHVREVGGDEGVRVVPFGVETTTVCSQSGAVFGTRFWKKDLPLAPSG